MRRDRAVRRRGAALLLLALGSLGSCGDDGDEPVQALRGAVREPPLQVASVHLPDAGNDGAPVAMQAPPGELYLVYFGYASCPDICPTTMSDIRVALEQLPAALADRVTVAMATVDPERDSAEVLTGYLGHFFDRAIALRAAASEELARAATAFGVQWRVEDHEPGEAYDVAHTAVTYVVDDTGTVVVEWPFGFESEAMVADLTTLLGEERT